MWTALLNPDAVFPRGVKLICDYVQVACSPCVLEAVDRSRLGATVVSSMARGRVVSRNGVGSPEGRRPHVQVEGTRSNALLPATTFRRRGERRNKQRRRGRGLSRREKRGRVSKVGRSAGSHSGKQRIGRAWEWTSRGGKKGRRVGRKKRVEGRMGGEGGGVVARVVKIGGGGKGKVDGRVEVEGRE